jgi:peroxiredoxin
MADNQPLKIGEMAPDFELMNQDKNKVKLSDYRGKKKVMLLFYPMDFSPTCTQEHCTFGPAFDKLNGPDADTVVFGVSCDSPFSHAAFRKQYNIPYDLLADTSRKMVKAYGMFAGEEPYNCSKRGTVVISKDGRIAHYHEQPMRDPRRVEDLEKASMIEDLLEQRDNEGGERISASR